MPRRLTNGSADVVFHVLNRGVRRMQLFDRPGDYRAFLGLVGLAQRRTPVRCLAYCVMPNHFHFVLWPRRDQDLSRFMAWLTITHSKRWHVWHGTTGTGHVYQGRFKAFPISTDSHFLQVCRYVERNPVRAGLVERAEDWSWSSLAQRLGQKRPIDLTDWPVPRPDDWSRLLQTEPSVETQEVRRAVIRGAPYGSDAWRRQVARRLGLERSLKPAGRPRDTSTATGSADPAQKRLPTSLFAPGEG